METAKEDLQKCAICGGVFDPSKDYIEYELFTAFDDFTSRCGFSSGDVCPECADMWETEVGTLTLEKFVKGLEDDE
jgi:hypothetical protein